MYRIMDETEIMIRQINDLRMVHFYNLAGQNNTEDGVLSIAVYFGQNGQINLSVLDKHFDLLVEQIFYHYAKLQDKSSIVADENTREILEKGTLEQTAVAWSKYLSMDGVEEPKYQAMSYFKGFLIPIVDYYLKQLYTMNKMEYKSYAYHLGWRNSCTIEGFVDKNTSKFIIAVEMQDERNFKVVVSNFIKLGATIEFHISYGLDVITIHFSSDFWSLDGDSRFYFEDGKLMDESFVRMNGAPVYYETVACEKALDMATKLSTISKLTGVLDDTMEGYLLPWGELFVNRVSGLQTRDYLYMLIDTNMGIVHEPFDCNGMSLVRGWSWRQITNEQANIVVKTLAMAYDRLLTKDNVVQTHFLSAGANSYGDYKEKLEERYFYENMEDSVWGS